MLDSTLHPSNPALPTPPRQCISTFPLFSLIWPITFYTTSASHLGISYGGAISIIGYLNSSTPIFWQAASYSLTLAPIERISTSLSRQTMRVIPRSAKLATSRVTSLMYFLPSRPWSMRLPGHWERPNWLLKVLPGENRSMSLSERNQEMPIGVDEVTSFMPVSFFVID